jgi:cytochrome c553
MKTEVNKYRGLTKRQYKQRYGSQTPGNSKGENCHATSLDKAMAKYPRAIKTMPDEYISFNLKKDRVAKRTNSFFTQNFGDKKII